MGMIKISVEENIATVILNRPEKRNALHPDLVKELKDNFNKLKSDKNLSSVIISGEGKSFCSGADLAYLNQLRDFSTVENEKDSQDLADLFLQIYNFPKPVIAAVNGAAIAGGCGLASVCDLIIADPENSKFGYSEVKIGFIPAIVSIFLIKKVGEGLAKQLLLTGEIINGRRAYEIGFVNYLAEDPLLEANNLAKKISKNSSFSMDFSKRMINSVSNLRVDEAVNYCIRLNTISRSSDDFKKGLENFLNKN